MKLDLDALERDIAQNCPNVTTDELAALVAIARAAVAWRNRQNVVGDETLTDALREAGL